MVCKGEIMKILGKKQFNHFYEKQVENKIQVTLQEILESHTKTIHFAISLYFEYILEMKKKNFYPVWNFLTIH